MAKLKQKALLPELEPPSIPEIDDAAETYYEAMKKRQKLSVQENEAQQNLLEVMKANKLDRYEFDSKVVLMTSKSKCRVKPKDDDNGDDNGDDE